MVMENGGVSRDWDWVKGILHLGEERWVTLQRAAPLTIVRVSGGASGCATRSGHVSCPRRAVHRSPFRNRT